MNITEKSLHDAAGAGIISVEQAEKLLAYLKDRPDQPGSTPRFDFTHILYYMGGLVAIGAMTLFMNLGWERFGGWGIFSISIIYAAIGLFLTERFRKTGYTVPAGICAAFVVALTPLAIYGIQQALGWWPADSSYREYHHYIRWHWIFLEFGTLGVGAVMAWTYRYPFLLMPVAVTLWYMSMDIAAMLAGDGFLSFQLRSRISMWFGLLITLLAFWVDVRSRKSADYAFWLYLFGVMAFWGGMTAQHSDSELAKFFYLCVNLLLVGVGVVIVRRVFVVFGALGCSLYLGHLAAEVFRDSWFFPIALTAIGFGIICLGVLWQKHEMEITQKVQSLLPLPLQELLAQKRS